MEARAIPKRYYTIAEWEKLPEYPRYELIDGEISMMAPPTWNHQRVSGQLFIQFELYLRGKRCKVAQDVGVRFLRNKRRPTIFIPDLVVVCDPKKIRPQGVVGAPDLIVEILSPSTGDHDKVEKLDRYLQEGVREYWIVDPMYQTVDVCQWVEGHQTLKSYDRNGKIKVSVLEDCVIDLALVFPASEEEGETEDADQQYPFR